MALGYRRWLYILSAGKALAVNKHSSWLDVLKIQAQTVSPMHAAKCLPVLDMQRLVAQPWLHKLFLRSQSFPGRRDAHFLLCLWECVGSILSYLLWYLYGSSHPIISEGSTLPFTLYCFLFALQLQLPLLSGRLPHLQLSSRSLLHAVTAPPCLQNTPSWTCLLRDTLGTRWWLLGWTM